MDYGAGFASAPKCSPSIRARERDRDYGGASALALAVEAAEVSSSSPTVTPGVTRRSSLT